MPKRMRSGPNTSSARRKTSVNVSVGACVAIHEFDEDVSTNAFVHWAPSISVSRRHPAPKWGTTKETFGNLSLKANVLAGAGDKKGAVAWAEKALAAGKVADGVDGVGVEPVRAVDRVGCEGRCCRNVQHARRS